MPQDALLSLLELEREEHGYDQCLIVWPWLARGRGIIESEAEDQMRKLCIDIRLNALLCSIKTTWVVITLCVQLNGRPVLGVRQY